MDSIAVDFWSTQTPNFMMSGAFLLTLVDIPSAAMLSPS
jgi:hypothetical protein